MPIHKDIFWRVYLSHHFTFKPEDNYISELFVNDTVHEASLCMNALLEDGNIKLEDGSDLFGVRLFNPELTRGDKKPPLIDYGFTGYEYTWVDPKEGCQYGLNVVKVHLLNAK
jgi:hypothetical protein